MISKKILIWAVLITLGFGCAQHSRHVILADQVIAQTAIQLKKEKGLVTIGTGGQMMGDIQLMRMQFYYFHLINLEEARKLIIYVTQIFLKNINDIKEIRPYLHDYPFTTKNIEITIWIKQPDGSSPPQGDIEGISIDNGKISYELTAPSKFEPWPILHQETYEEALKILGEIPLTAKNIENDDTAA